MDIFRDYKFSNTDRTSSFEAAPERNSSAYKVARYDRFLDTSKEVSVEDTKYLKVDRVDRM
jgi:hypothetical protein